MLCLHLHSYILSSTVFSQNNSIRNRVIERTNKRTALNSYAIYPLNNSIYQIIFERKLLKNERNFNIMDFAHYTLKKKKLNSNVT